MTPRIRIHFTPKPPVGVVAFESNRSLTFHHTAVKLATVKLALLQQEALEIREGVLLLLDNTVSPSVLISTGLELEEQQ